MYWIRLGLGDERSRESMRKGIIGKPTEAKLGRYFDEKIKFLENQKKIDSPTVRTLSAIHRYRNEAYHQNKVRPETIRPVVLLLFELACDLLVALRLRSYSERGGNDWSYFEQLFGVSAHSAMSETGTKRIREVLRDGLALDPADLAESLADHLETRFDEFRELFENHVSRGLPLDETISNAKKWIVRESQAYQLGDRAFKKAAEEFTLAELESLKHGAEVMRKARDKVTLFAAFSELETAFEPIENCLFDLTSEIDQIIDLAIQAARER
jgi:hypothetical protein